MLTQAKKFKVHEANSGLQYDQGTDSLTQASKDQGTGANSSKKVQGTALK
ncbi:hypothetical protein HYD70_03750 [Mycoplasmopsis bovis]|nr:hypothetical protein [Mycoplasmopsis bovis]QQH49853.1 hypothetical protein HYD70_03750 [Mycoplasmopsis bovis]